MLTLAKSIQPLAPGASKALSYVDQNGVRHVLDTSGVDTVVSGRAWHNWIGNSGFWFAQRQAPGTATTYSSLTGRVFGPDRWAITNQNASATYQRTDTASAPET